MKKQLSSKSKYWLWICIVGLLSVAILYITTQNFSVAQSNDEVIEMELSSDESNNLFDEEEEGHSTNESNNEVITTEISQEENNSSLDEKIKTNSLISMNEYDAIVNLFKSESVTVDDVTSMIHAEPINIHADRIYEYEGENEDFNVTFRFAHDGTLLYITENNLYDKSTNSISLDQLYDETMKINDEIWQNYKVETLDKLFTGELSMDEVIRETEMQVVFLEVHSDKLEKFHEENDNANYSSAITDLKEGTLYRSDAFLIMRRALEENSDLSEAEQKVKLVIEISDQRLLEATKKLGGN
ncbi:hypothetical protein FLK61_28660 [Paenalkalicoccus suaedae]|uniref:Uncharacterized protein n=1 Tax=Paenalkalicoccus suaedae TaxID=2592382 RepID=A0A859FD86_9BACI|nr:hypothetical protein [Paenalkalicoccus suaedae]QKS70712.1 hypothetical protein FLK61_28660 [Paenalkalicoccus suaedae]